MHWYTNHYSAKIHVTGNSLGNHHYSRASMRAACIHSFLPAPAQPPFQRGLRKFPPQKTQHEFILLAIQISRVRKAKLGKRNPQDAHFSSETTPAQTKPWCDPELPPVIPHLYPAVFHDQRFDCWVGNAAARMLVSLLSEFIQVSIFSLLFPLCRSVSTFPVSPIFVSFTSSLLVDWWFTLYGLVDW